MTNSNPVCNAYVILLEKRADTCCVCVFFAWVFFSLHASVVAILFMKLIIRLHGMQQQRNTR